MKKELEHYVLSVPDRDGCMGGIGPYELGKTYNILIGISKESKWENLTTDEMITKIKSLLLSNKKEWIGKSPYPYENKDKLLVAESYKENWVESSVEKYPDAVQKAKEVLREWGQNSDKYEYEGKTYDYEIRVSESPNFISVVFSPVGLEGLEQHVEIRMTKKDFIIVSVLSGS